MRRLLTVTAFVLGMALTAPAWSHHMAEGVISDELWEQINLNLIAADAGHLTVPLPDWLDSLGSMDNPDSGRAELVSYIEVAEEDVATYEAALLDAMADMENRVPSGNTSSGTASILDYDIIEPEVEGDLWVIVIYEPVGGGQSQDLGQDLNENPGEGDDPGLGEDPGQGPGQEMEPDDPPVAVAPRKRR